MKAIQSFRSDNIRPALESFGGGSMIKGQLFSMALSTCTIAKHYPYLEYVTDDAGEEMAKICKLPFSKIISVGKNFNSDASFWTHSKFESYKSSEPFLHFDNDLFLWKPLPDWVHEADIVALHGESFMWPLYEDYIKEALSLPNWPILHETYFYNRTPINMAIFGGKDTGAINAYTKEVLNLVLAYFQSPNLTEEDKNKLNKIMPVIEQLWGSQIIQCKLNKRINFLISEKSASEKSTTEDVNLTHLGGKKGMLQKDSKQTHEIYQKIIVNLKKINPEVYKAVQDFTSSPNNIDKLMESV